MPSLDVENISKTFGQQKAVDDVTFSVDPGEIFGLLGPNGAGKTTAIRIILDIFKPDRGKVSILGGPMTEEKKNRIGYLPEERGLYQDITLDRCLNYLATLKGLSSQEARRRIGIYLDRFDLTSARQKKLKEMSKGMQQKAQLIVTLVHEPELVIVDEPFSSLDPVNTQMVKDILRELRDKGVTIVMCTHQMHQVEELCDRLILINRGQAILYGRLEDIRRQFSGQELIVRTAGPLPALDGVQSVTPYDHTGYRLSLSSGTSPHDVLKSLVAANADVEQFEIALPTLDEIFIQVVQGRENQE